MIETDAATTTIDEAVRRLDMSPNGLRYWIRRGRIRTVVTPLGRVVLEESLREFTALRGKAKEQARNADDR